MAAWTEPYSGSASISTTEYSLTNNSTTIAAKTDKGTLQGVIDFNALTNAEVYELRVLEKCRSGDTQRALYVATIVGGQGDSLRFLPALMLGIGWDVTLKKISGTDRTILWDLRAYT